MAHGKLQCFGSPLFLKNKFGVGYTLTIVKNQHLHPDRPAVAADDEQQHAITTTAAAASGTSAHPHTQHAVSFVEMSKRLTALVATFIPEAEPLSDVGAEQSFRLPFAASNVFVELFSAFDSQKEILGIAEYGISVTTLEEVFIRVGELEESLNEAPPEPPRHLSEEDEWDRPSQRLSLQDSAAAALAVGSAGNKAHSPKQTTPSVVAGPAKSSHVPASVAAAADERAEEAAHANSVSSSTTNRLSDSSHPPHGILHTDHHHHHHRVISSEHAHKRVSFRDSDENSPMQLAAAQAALASPPAVTITEKGTLLYV